MSIDLNVTHMGGESLVKRTPNEALFASVGTGLSFQTAEDAIDVQVGTYTNTIDQIAPEQRFGVAPQFVGVNPFSSMRRF